MRCYVGIDLGSTTTKAVVLDDQGDVLGRGITNSRSNYDVACDVARHEAYMDVRFNMLSARLDTVPELVALRTKADEDLLDAVKKRFRMEQYLGQLAELHGTCLEHGRESKLTGPLEDIFVALREEAPSLFCGDAKPRSDFFRDIAGSSYMARAEEIARKDTNVSYDALLGIYDKSIIAVEAEVPETRLQEVIERALDRTLEDIRLDGVVRDRLVELVRETIDTPLVDAVSVGTGYGRARLPFPREHIRSEILCHGLGAHTTFPGTRTVLDIGGQDTKAIQVNDAGIVTSFQMNDRCAAGCGRYLGYIADEMNLGLHELGPLAQKGKRPVRINSTCTVFAGAEMRDRLAMGQRREDILAGLHRAIMLRAMSLLARSGGVTPEFTFTGGVANNGAAVEALRKLVKENYGIEHINISPSSIYTGALGAAIFAMRHERGETDEVREHALAGGAA